MAPVPVQTGENWWLPRGMANSIAADASDLAMVDIMKIGGVLNAMGKADAASLPLSSHTFTEHLDIAGGVLTERCSPTTEW